MVYKGTEEVVRRVMPLLDRLATRTVDKARLLQYLSARAGVDWHVLELVADREAEGPEAVGGAARVLTVRDPTSGAEHSVRYPAWLSPELEPLVREEYKRLAMDRPLTAMAEPLFDHFFRESHCAHCRWRGPEHAQIHFECRFAGSPVNFEPAE
jgi:hypothetical protein